MNGRQVRELREAIGLKRPQLCEKAGPPLTVAKLAGIETGRPPRLDELKALEAAFRQYDVGRRFFEGQPITDADPNAELKNARVKDDADRWTSANPSVKERLEQTTKNLRGGRRRRAVTMPVNTKFQKFTEWGTMRAGDAVKIRSTTVDEPGRDNWLRGSWTFVQRVYNTETEESWVDVRGGNNKIQVRSFTEDRVVAIFSERIK